MNSTRNSPVTYLSRDEIVAAHDALLEKYGGSTGIRNEKVLELLVNKPKMILEGKDAYPTLFNKAAVVCHALLFERPFIDGNQRAAFAACHLMLLMNEWQLTATPDEASRFFADVLKNSLDWSQISLWLKISSQQKSVFRD